MRNFLRYDENTNSILRPRHPIVALNDLCLTVGALICFLIAPAAWYIKVYFAIVALMFAVSAIHHTLRYATWHHKLDRCMIYVLIAGTVLPYWPQIQMTGRAHGVYLLCVFVLLGILLKFFNVAARKGLLATALYSSLGLVSVYTLAPTQSVLGNVWAVWMWFGVFVYTLSMISYNLKWFDFYPELLGYREFQHFPLLSIPVVVHCTLVFIFATP